LESTGIAIEEVDRRRRGEEQQKMKYEAQEGHGMRSRGQLEIAKPENSSWMPCSPQGLTRLDDDHHHHYTMI
jgi:hypothetical protein